MDLITELGKLLPLVALTAGAIAYLHSRFSKTRDDVTKIAADLYLENKDLRKQIASVQLDIVRIQTRLNMEE